MQFSILNIIGYTVYWSCIAWLFSSGEYGISLIPACICLHLFALPVLYRQRTKCPDMMKIRYHVPFVFLGCAIAGPGFLFEYGVWRLPFSGILSVFIAPAVVLVTQLIKFADRPCPSLWLRSTQLFTIWSVTLTNIVVSQVGTIISLA